MLGWLTAALKIQLKQCYVGQSGMHAHERDLASQFQPEVQSWQSLQVSHNGQLSNPESVQLMNTAHLWSASMQRGPLDYRVKFCNITCTQNYHICWLPVLQQLYGDDASANTILVGQTPMH